MICAAGSDLPRASALDRAKISPPLLSRLLAQVWLIALAAHLPPGTSLGGGCGPAPLIGHPAARQDEACAHPDLPADSEKTYPKTLFVWKTFLEALEDFFLVFQTVSCLRRRFWVLEDGTKHNRRHLCGRRFSTFVEVYETA